MPVYKVENYLERCIQSIVNQNYFNLEIILINDGSPDCCPEICDHWAKKDSRIRVIHQENTGLSSARNAGIDLSTGKYLTFVDSDDVIEIEMIEFLHYILKQSKADISQTSIQALDTEPVPGSDFNAVITASSEDILYKIIYEKQNWEACGKLYKKSLFDEGLRFPINKLFEDLYLTPRIFKIAKKVAYCDNALYRYSQREDSIMGRTNRKLSLDLIWVLEENISFIKNNYESNTKIYGSLFARFVAHPSTVLELVEKNNSYSLNEDYIAAYKKFMRHHWDEVKSNSYLSGKLKFGLFLSMHLPTLYNKLFKIIRQLHKKEIIKWER